MNDRLRNPQPADAPAAVRRAAELLRGEGPLDVPASMEARVWRRLQAGERPARRPLRPAVIALWLLAAAGAAAAAWQVAVRFSREAAVPASVGARPATEGAVGAGERVDRAPAPHALAGSPASPAHASVAAAATAAPAATASPASPPSPWATSVSTPRTPPAPPRGNALAPDRAASSRLTTPSPVPSPAARPSPASANAVAPAHGRIPSPTTHALPKTTPPAVAPAAPASVAASTAQPRPPVPLAAPPRATSRVAEEASLLVAATSALRTRARPDLAQQILRRYWERHPQGEMAEEALALSIEAALGAKDPSAPTLGKAYLVRYPNGRYADLARRATLD